VQIVKYPASRLRHKSKPLRRVDADLLRIVRRDVRFDVPPQGIGLAANQVDLPYRLFISMLRPIRPPRRGTRLHQPGHLAPHRHGRGGRGLPELSDIFARVKRSSKVSITAYNIGAKKFNTISTACRPGRPT